MFLSLPAHLKKRKMDCQSEQNKSLDQISQLPGHIILLILSFLPLRDAARASILSKTWKSVCSLYPILYLDHNLFALNLLVSDRESDGEPDSSEIRDRFVEYVGYRLSRAKQLNLPVRKVALNMAINDSSYFSHVDQWMELVRQTNVENLCFSVLTDGFNWEYGVLMDDVCYEFPISVLASKGLQSVYVFGCKLKNRAFACDPIINNPVTYFSLKQLCLSHVFFDYNVFENLVRCCPGIETLDLDHCTLFMEFLQLSKFTKLKKALLVELQGIDLVDIEHTNLQSFKCDAQVDCLASPDACGSIRELTLSCTLNPPDLFKDLTAAFPLIEEAEIDVNDIDRLKAANNHLRKLTVHNIGLVCVREVHVDCPNLTAFECHAHNLEKVYIDCPKLKQFHYFGSSVPTLLSFNSSADILETNLNLACYSPMATFDLEEGAIQTSQQHNIDLTVSISEDMRNKSALVDGLLWSTRPTTLLIYDDSYDSIKYICENLAKKTREESCLEQLCNKCWWHHIEDFEVESTLEFEDIKGNMAAFVELCITTHKAPRFRLCWCSK